MSSRPGGGEPRLAEDTFDDQTVDARLWQDPLGVAIESRAKEATQDEMHSIERFQQLFIGRCYPELGSSPLKPPEEKTNQIAIVAVMVPGGPYVEDVERRLRSRRAVIEGLSSTFRSASSFQIHPYTYLRGIDGKLPDNKDAEKETKNSAENGKNNPSSSRPTEQTEGLNQADDIRRLAEMLRQLDIDWRQEGGLKAVGLIGSDVYDKLELLRALRPVLPQTTFFTNHLEARFSHPDEWKETHNLIVVSENTLSLKGLGQDVAPFRDSGQTDLFQATLEAMG